MPKKPKKFYKKAPSKIIEPKEEKKTQKQSKEESIKIEKKKKKTKDPKTDSGFVAVPKTTKEKESPKNSRSIAEKKNSASQSTKIILLSLIGILSLGGIIWAGNQAREQYIQFEKVDQERKNLENMFVQWEEEAIAHPGSRDIYLHLATVSFELKNIQNAKKFIQKALEIDPNYQPALDLQKKLEE